MQNDLNLCLFQGKVYEWDFEISEVIGVLNEKEDIDEKDRTPRDWLFLYVAQWVVRYFEEGVTDNFIQDLNKLLVEVQMLKQVQSIEAYPSENGPPRSGYFLRDMNLHEPKVLAAYEFSILLSNGMLQSFKRCKSETCRKFFEGRPNQIWCSESCGSNARQRRKRRKDAEYK